MPRLPLLSLVLCCFSSPLLAQSSSTPSSLKIPAGIYVFGDREAYVNEFTIEQSAGSENRCTADDKKMRPSVEEWLAAAQQKKFQLSGAFEMVQAPLSIECSFTQAELEAEGILGEEYMAGWGKKLSQGMIVANEGDARTGIVSMGSNAWNFWGEEAKPSPRKERCVTMRKKTTSLSRWIEASKLNLRAGRSKDFKAVHQVTAGDEVKLLHKSGEWAYISTTKYVYDSSGEIPTYQSCLLKGWVKEKFLAPSAPNLLSYIQEAEKALADKKVLAAVTPAERAAAMQPQNSYLQTLVADLYRRVKSKDAKRAKKNAKALRKHSRSKAWSPKDPLFELATWCKAPPAPKQKWQLLTRKVQTGCALAWLKKDAAGYMTKSAKGYIDVDLKCSTSPQDTRITPEFLYLQVPKRGNSSRGIQLSARNLEGSMGEDGFTKTGLGPWRTIGFWQHTNEAGEVFKVPMPLLAKGANHAVQLRVELFPLGKRGLKKAKREVRFVDVVWPALCK